MFPFKIHGINLQEIILNENHDHAKGIKLKA